MWFNRLLGVTVVFLLSLLFFTPAKAESIVWSNSNFTDCSGQGGTNSDWSNVCFDQNGNFNDSGTIVNHYYSNFTDYKVAVIPGHTYVYQDSVDNFSNTGTDIVVRQIFNEPGLNSFAEGTYTGSNWAYMNTGAQFTDTFLATSDYVYIVYWAGCNNSTGCHVSHASLTDLGDLTPSPGWISLTPFLQGLASHWSFAYNNKLYILGGGNLVSPQVSAFAGINTDGTISTWQNTLSMLPSIYWITGVQDDNYIYVLGGAHIPDYNNVNSVLLAKIEDNGDIINWQELTPLPQYLSQGSSVIMGNKIYYAGGDSNSHDLLSSKTKEIYMTEINPYDHTIGQWSLVGYLPEKMYGFGMLEINSYLYVFGGYREGGVSPKVQRAPIDPNSGTIGVWQDLNYFPKPIGRPGFAHIGNMIVSAGGHDGTLLLTDLYYAFVNPDGTISQWVASSDTLPDHNCCSQLTPTETRFYLSGGHDGIHYFNGVYMTDINTILGLPSYTFLGFNKPVDNQPIINSVKAGRTIPIKWSLKDKEGNYISSLDSTTNFGYSGPVACGGTAVTVEEYTNTSDTTLKYDPDSNQFILNSKTDSAWTGSCRTFTLNLNDGTTHQITFQFTN